jgi:hypothetical protein
MPIALVTNTIKQSVAGATVVTDAIDTTGANLLVVSIADYEADSSILSDNYANTWTPLTAATSVPDALRQRLYYCLGALVGAGHTFTATPNLSAHFATISVAAFSGVKTASAFDQENGATSATTASMATGSITPSENNELVVSGLLTGTANVIAISGLTITNQVPNDPGDAFGAALAYVVQTSAGAVNPTWTWSGGAAAGATVASFRALEGPTQPVFWRITDIYR